MYQPQVHNSIWRILFFPCSPHYSWPFILQSSTTWLLDSTKSLHECSNYSGCCQVKQQVEHHAPCKTNYTGHFDPWELKANKFKSWFLICRSQSSVELLQTRYLSELSKSSKAVHFQRVVASWFLWLRQDWDGTVCFLSYIQHRERLESRGPIYGWYKGV